MTSFVMLQPVVLDLLNVGRRYALMETEIARLNQQTASLQGKVQLPPFLHS